MKKTNWKNFILVDSEGYRFIYPCEKFISAMKEFKITGCIHGLFFTEPLKGQERLDRWEWGPSPTQVDWTGLSGGIQKLGG